MEEKDETLKEEKEKKEKKQHKTDKLKELEEKLKQQEEETLRAKADLINYRKRKDEEVSNILKYANSDILNSLLLVVDNFERALNIKEEELTNEQKSFLSGFKMIYTNLKEILDSNGVKEIDCLGKRFDSKYQNCLFTETDNTKEDEIVLDVLVKGYTYNDKILRCASVKVNKIDNKNNEMESVKNE